MVETFVMKGLCAMNIPRALFSEEYDINLGPFY